MNVSPITVDFLKKAGYNAVRVNEALTPTADDIAIIEHAKHRNYIIITFDLDFTNILAIKGFEKPSVISLRIDSALPDDLNKVLIDVIKEYEDDLNKGIIISVDDISIRHRSLPIIKQKEY